jgi:cobalamin-dependent methionine synthase I
MIDRKTMSMNAYDHQLLTSRSIGRDRTNNKCFVNSKRERKEEKSFMHRVKLLNKYIHPQKKKKKKEKQSVKRKEERKREISKQNKERKKKKKKTKKSTIVRPIQ